MPISKLGQLYTPANSDEIRDQFLRDIRLSAVASGMTDPPVQPGTDWFNLGTAIANIGLIGLANMSLGLDAQSVLDATGVDLERLRVAYGLAEVPPAPASGKLKLSVTSLTTLVDGTQFTYPNGLRGKVVGTYPTPIDGDEVNVIAIDTGSGTNLAALQIVQFVSPPVGIATAAKVSLAVPLTGGTDAETDERKRERIINTLKNKPAGGNWQYLRDLAVSSLGSLTDCYVYPALGGPGSCKVVPVKALNPSINDFSRAVPSGSITYLRGIIQAAMPAPQDIIVQSVQNQPCDAALKVTIPNSSLSGGNGSGWLDSAPWPPLVAGDNGRVTITAVTDGATFTVSAQTATPPVDGQTHIAWWSYIDRKFRTALIVATTTGGAGAWVLHLDRPLASTGGGLPLIGDFVCPPAQNLEKYGAAWIDLLGALGPAENAPITDTGRIPRANRHPLISDEDPSDLNAVTLTKIASRFPEITDIYFGYTNPATPTVPGSVDIAPNILVPQNFGVYKF